MIFDFSKLRKKRLTVLPYAQKEVHLCWVVNQPWHTVLWTQFERPSLHPHVDKLRPQTNSHCFDQFSAPANLERKSWCPKNRKKKIDVCICSVKKGEENSQSGLSELGMPGVPWQRPDFDRSVRTATANLSQARSNILPQIFWPVVSYKSVLKPKI